MIKGLLTISAFTLIFMVSASAQDGIGKRRNFTTSGEQQRRDLYGQQQRRARDERRDNTVLGQQPWWRTQNWCDADGVLFLCR
jgi:hypothetical protein